MHTDIHDIVNDYSERGWALVPNALCTKKPIISKWQTICADPDAAKTLFAAHKNSNIGIVLGAASGGIVDVDLDGPNAAVVAQHLLPYTRLRFGRASKPNSHWLYRVPNPGSIKQFEHPETGAMLVELRGKSDIKRSCRLPSTSPVRRSASRKVGRIASLPLRTGTRWNGVAHFSPPRLCFLITGSAGNGTALRCHSRDCLPNVV